MSEYLHGAYGVVRSAVNRIAAISENAMVYFGTAPVHQLALADGASYPVNKPILCNNIAEARAAFGYSDNWGSYTLCEAMHVHFELNGVGPLILINVLDPTKEAHKLTPAITGDFTPAGGQIVITSAEDIILESVVITTKAETPVTKVKGTDYTIAYNPEKQQIVIHEIDGGLGTSALSVTYYKVNPAGVTSTDVIGTTDGKGVNTGLYCVNDVYPLTGAIPNYIAAPGFSSTPAVNAAMVGVSRKINGHWDAWVYADLPLTNGGLALDLDTVAAYKAANGYNAANETVYFPMVLGTDNKKYHISVLAAANFQAILIMNDGIPYKVASNTDCAIARNLYLGEANTGRLYDDSIINKYLNANGIVSACFVAGRWCIWGCHAAQYNPEDANEVNVSETNLMILFYVSNDFQSRRSRDVDKPVTANDIKSIVAEEQTRIDALVSIGALIYGTVRVNASADTKSDIINGDFSFMFDLTPTPIARSLKAYVNWTDEGFATYFESMTE